MIGVHPWGLDAESEGALLHALRFRWFKWDTYACGDLLVLNESLVLDRADHEQVVRITEGLHETLGRFEERVLSEPGALRALGIPEAVQPLVLETPAASLQCTRYDLFATEDGRWMVSEFNEDVPGGFNEAAGIPELLGPPSNGLTWEGDFRGQVVDALAPYETIALLYATSFAEDLQHMLVLEDWLRSAGHETVLASPEHLEDGRLGGLGFGGPRFGSRPGARFLGRRVDAAFRFFPGEWMAQLPNLAAWRRWGHRLPMMNPLRALVRQSKTVFSLLRDDGSLPAEDRALISRHLPYTEPFRPERGDELREERERWVLKRAFGRMGDAVVLGSLVTAREWDRALADAAREPHAYCIQERFRVKPVEFRSGPLYPAIGAYLVNGRFAGYYSRVASRPFITHEAHHVATLVHTA
jgi:glutathionylspermidine synthase